MRQSRRTIRTPRGITLLELLIVMVILLMVTAAAIPIVAPAMRNRQMRESTRLVSAFFGAAQAEAVRTGRPVGVRIERFNGLPFAFTLSQVAVPPPYSGDTTTARATLTDLAGGPPGGWNFAQWFTATMTPADFNPAMVRIGDTIQFNNQGYHYTILGPDTNSDGIVDNATLSIAYLSQTQITGRIFFPWAGTTQPVSYQIFRQPQRSSVQPLTLPEGIVVDLSVSGVGSQLFNIADYSGAISPTVKPPVVTFDPMLIFSPSGRLDLVTDRAGQLVRPTDSVFLLIGRRELMFDATTRGTQQDLVFQNLSAVGPSSASNTVMPPAENFWVTVGYQTGQASVTEVAQNLQDYKNASGSYQYQQDVALNAIDQSRVFARQSQSVGGR